MDKPNLGPIASGLGTGDGVTIPDDDGNHTVKGVIVSIRRTNGPDGFAMIQTADELKSVPLSELKADV